MPRVTSPKKSTPRNRSVTSESSHGGDQPKGRKKFAAGKGLQAPEEDRSPKPTTSGKSPKPAKSHPRRTAHESESSSPLLVGNEPERIAKRLARAGLCSRREAERWIEERRVSVDGKVLDTPAVLVGPDSDILVDGEPFPEAVRPRVWRYHKPQGLVTSHGDPQGRPHLNRTARSRLRRASVADKLRWLVASSGIASDWLDAPLSRAGPWTCGCC